MHPPLAKSKALFDFANPDRYLPIANIYRIMKNTVDPVAQKQKQDKKSAA